MAGRSTVGTERGYTPGLGAAPSPCRLACVAHHAWCVERRDEGVRDMRPGRIIAIVVGSIVAVIGLALLIGGIAATVAYGVARDDDGYFRTDEIHLTTTTSAITSDSLDLG